MPELHEAAARAALHAAECRSCHAAVIWARTEAGKPMPIDAEPRPDGNLIIVGTLEGSPLVKVDPPGLFDDPSTARYVSHFATCPNADEHRRPR